MSLHYNCIGSLTNQITNSVYEELVVSVWKQVGDILLEKVRFSVVGIVRYGECDITVVHLIRERDGV